MSKPADAFPPRRYRGRGGYGNLGQVGSRQSQDVADSLFCLFCFWDIGLRLKQIRMHTLDPLVYFLVDSERCRSAVTYNDSIALRSLHILGMWEFASTLHIILDGPCTCTNTVKAVVTHFSNGLTVGSESIWSRRRHGSASLKR
jgi:hypothetical protein